MISATPAGRSRPGTRPLDPNSTPELLLEAATALMVERESPDISLAEVGERTGLSRALVLYYFGSKEGMLLAVLDRGVAQATAQLAELAGADLPAVTKLRRHVAGLLRTYITRPYANRLLHILMLPDNPARAEKVMDSYVRPVADFHQTLISQGVREGSFRAIDPKLFYFALVGATEHFTSRRSVLTQVFGEPGITDALRRDYEEFLFQIAMRMLAPVRS